MNVVWIVVVKGQPIACYTTEARANEKATEAGGMVVPVSLEI